MINVNNFRVTLECLFRRKELAPHVQAFARCYTSDWKVVNYQHRQCSSSVAPRAFSPHHSVIHSSPRQEFEIDFQSSTEPSESGKTIVIIF